MDFYKIKDTNSEISTNNAREISEKNGMKYDEISRFSSPSKTNNNRFFSVYFPNPNSFYSIHIK